MAKSFSFPAVSKKTSWSQRGKASLKAFFPLMTPVIMLWGILGGIFTPTEASAVAAAYAMFIGLFVLAAPWAIGAIPIPASFEKAPLLIPSIINAPKTPPRAELPE